MTNQAQQIAKGFFNSLTNRKEELSSERKEICLQCKLYKADGIFGPECNSDLHLNPKTDETSTTAKIGFFNGCGCVINSKTRVQEASCPAGKW